MHYFDETLNQDKTITSSFFCKDYMKFDKFPTFWTKIKKGINALVPEKNVILEGQFTAKSKYLARNVQRYFKVTNDFICFNKNAQYENNWKIASLINTIAEFQQKQQKGIILYITQLTKYNKSISLSTDNSEKFEELKQHLSKRCILLSFHSDFGILKQIGKGNFARVYLAKHCQTHQLHAIKSFSKSQLIAKNQASDQGPASIQNEIFILRQLNHPFILNLNYVYETPNSVYLVTELVQGGPLFKKINSATTIYHKEDIKILIKNLLLVVSELAKLNIMHRDLKPDNILLQSQDNKYEIKVIDFGLACQRDKINKGVILYRRCGTPGYVAPEILSYIEKQQLYGLKCDIFSLGVLFYILLVGKQPFHNSDFKNILRDNKKCEINFDVKELQKYYNKPILDLLKLMLKANPEERISADDALMHPFFHQNEMNMSQSLNCFSPIYVSLQRFFQLTISYSMEISFKENVENKQNCTMESSEINNEMVKIKIYHQFQGLTDTIQSVGNSISSIQYEPALSPQKKESLFSQNQQQSEVPGNQISILDNQSKSKQNHQLDLKKLAFRNAMKMTLSDSKKTKNNFSSSSDYDIDIQEQKSDELIFHQMPIITNENNCITRLSVEKSEINLEKN